MLILNDVHLGFHRSGGTTPVSREAARQYLFTAFEEMLIGCEEEHVLILGDLFDEFEVAGRDWLQTYLVLQDWMFTNPNRKLTLVAGNHDWSPKATKVSSFEMLCKVLTEQFGDRVVIVNIDEHAEVEPGVVAVAHCSNQDLFDQRLEEVIKLGARSVLLHANYDNNFATHSDHSLNVSAEWAKRFNDAGATLFFAHEHQARAERNGGVVVFGNQWPTSVSDCLNNDEKFAHRLVDGRLTKIRTWKRDAEAGYDQVPWEALAEYPVDGGAKFIRVFGFATANQAGDCLSAIAKFRSKSDAFVITNAVKIEGVAENEALPEQFEATKTFDVMEFINSNLDPAQQAAVKKLQEARQ